MWLTIANNPKIEIEDTCRSFDSYPRRQGRRGGPSKNVHVSYSVVEHNITNITNIEH